MSYTGSKAQAGRGTQFSIGSLAGTLTPTYVLVGEVKTSGITGAQWGTEDVTNSDSGPDQEFISTIRDNGTLDLSGNRVASDAGQVAVEAAFGSGLKYDFKLVLPINVQAGQSTVGDTYTFAGLVQSRDFSIDVTKAISFSTKIKVSGAVTYAVGS
jgi:hypothetical protein